MDVWVLKVCNNPNLHIFDNADKGIDELFKFLYTRGYEEDECGWEIEISETGFEYLCEGNFEASLTKLEVEF